MLVYILFIVGFFLLLKGADFLIDGASALARKLGVQPIFIGLTVVAFGTTLPEFTVNMFSAFGGVTDVALGNIVGSEIFNILVIMGIAALIFPIKFQHCKVWREMPFLLIATLFLFVAANDMLLGSGPSVLTRTEGIFMLFFFSIYLYYIIQMAKGEKMKYSKAEKVYKSHKIVLLIICGAIGLFLGGRWVVEGAVLIARQLGMSEFLISVTIVAAGTSLPELVTAVRAAMKKRMDISIGDLVGANILNIFWIMGLTSIITPVAVSAYINFDMIVMILTTVLLFLFMFIGTRHQLDRWQGMLFLAIYVTYMILIIMRG